MSTRTQDTYSVGVESFYQASAQAQGSEFYCPGVSGVAADPEAKNTATRSLPERTTIGKGRVSSIWKPAKIAIYMLPSTDKKIAQQTPHENDVLEMDNIANESKEEFRASKNFPKYSNRAKIVEEEVLYKCVITLNSTNLLQNEPFGRHSSMRMGLTCKGVPAMWFKFTQRVSSVFCWYFAHEWIIKFVFLWNSECKLHSTVPLFLVYSCAGNNDNTTKFCTSFSLVHAV